jgi:hypothetical protein
MRVSFEYDDPRRILTHASLYLWRQWRLYGLAAWQDAMCILRLARIDVEEEDESFFLENMDVFLNRPSAGAALSDCKPAA